MQSALMSFYLPPIHTGPAGLNNAYYCRGSDWCQDFIHAISGGSVIILMLEIFISISVALYLIDKVSDH